MRRHALLLGGTLTLILLWSCGGKTVERVDPNTVIDLSGRWNDADSRFVAEEMIREILNHPWIVEHMQQTGGRRPVVIVGAIRNRSMEHIPVATFVRDIERALINSGRVSVVASAEERGEIRAEREDQRINASLETIKRMGRELGADYMLTGEISTIEDREGGRQVRFYQVDLVLTNIETNEKVWLGQKKIKKYIEQSRFGA
ncbi:MAG: hypothetical protein KatS3mg115_2508 [Candidatus Poribacteria bacterium]|nr:MAG: hypothetical protein KatS3mg115_2508 [Candidatus Poribacteria bacterium]